MRAFIHRSVFLFSVTYGGLYQSARLSHQPFCQTLSSTRAPDSHITDSGTTCSLQDAFEHYCRQPMPTSSPLQPAIILSNL